MVVINNDGTWIYLKNQLYFKKRLTGKYLFFSDDQNVLLHLGKKLLLENNLYCGKISLKEKNNVILGFGFVLCVYDSKKRSDIEEKLKEVKEYDGNAVSYHGWKTNKQTLNGEYPEFEYLVKREQREVIIKNIIFSDKHKEIFFDDSDIGSLKLFYKKAKKFCVGDKLKATLRTSGSSGDFFSDIPQIMKVDTVCYVLESLKDSRGRIIYKEKTNMLFKKNY